MSRFSSDVDARGWLAGEDLGDAMPRCEWCDEETTLRDPFLGVPKCGACQERDEEAAFDAANDRAGAPDGRAALIADGYRVNREGRR